jgi:DNA-binding CsgD family transcriptional regulator
MTPEETIIKLASAGRTDKQIAVEMGMRQEHVAALWKKVLTRAKTRSRTELIAKLLSEEYGQQISALSNELAALRSETAEIRSRDLMNEAAQLRLSAVMNSLRNGVLFESSDRRILRVNRAFCEMFLLPEGAESYEEQPAGSVLTETHRSLLKQGRLDDYTETTDWIELADGRTIERSHVVIEHDGHLFGHFWVFRDATETRSEVRQLQFRGDLAGLILDLSADIVAGKVTGDASIRKMMATVATAVDADRVYVIKVENGGLETTHEWCAPGIQQRVTGVPSSLKAWWLKHLKSDGFILLTSLDSIPSNEGQLRDFLKAQGVRSVVAVPIMHGRDLVGYMGFDSVRQQRSWTPEVVLLLQSMARMTTATLFSKSKRFS